MKIGFSILSHKAPNEPFVELLRQLSKYPNTEIVIHHDFSKADFDLDLNSERNVHVIEKYEKTKWSHVNNIKALIKTFTILYEQNCEWFITLSANCYPIKPFNSLVEFLNTSEFDAYMECNNINSDHFDFYKYFRKALRTKYLFSIPFIKRTGEFYFKSIRVKRDEREIIFDANLVPYQGSDWFMINRKSMEYILANLKLIEDMCVFLSEVNKGPDLNLCPPEIVFQTLIANNIELKKNNDNYRYIDWTNAKEWHPNTLVLKDFDKLKQSNAFFARKINFPESLELINKLNNSILDE